MCALNFMCSMERFATEIYRRQRGGFRQKALAEKLAYAVENESQHASNLKHRILDLKGTPFPLAFLFQAAGCLLGLVRRCMSRTAELRMDVAIEKRAVKDYGYFLRSLQLDDASKSLIRGIIADEEEHVSNWQDGILLVQGKQAGND